MAKKSKKEKKADKAAKKADKKQKISSKAGKVASTLASNPAVAEIVAAALVGAAAALRNPDKARKLATAASDNLEKMGKDAAEKGSALWSLALEVGRRSMETLDLMPAEKQARAAPKKPAARKPAAAKKAPARKAPARKPAARKTPPKKS